MNEHTDVPAKTDTGPPMRRWDPLHGLAQLQADLDRFWEGRALFPTFRRLVEPATTWTPRVDVFNKNGAIVVKAEVPGIPKEAIGVSVEDGMLVISGERKNEEEVKETDFYRMERSYGSFYRRLPLPEGVKADAIEAEFADGVLEVTIPRPATEEAKPVKVEIK